MTKPSHYGSSIVEKTIVTINKLVTECISIDYVNEKNIIVSREWVCPDAEGIIGEKGKQWWINRIGFLPKNINEAFELAKRLPGLYEERIFNPYNKKFDRIIKYKRPLPNKRKIVEGKFSVFLKDEDELDRNLHVLELKPSIKRTNKIFRPWWWETFVIRSIKKSSPKLSSSPEVLNQILLWYREKIKIDIPSGFPLAQLGLAYMLSKPPVAEELFAILKTIPGWKGDSIIYPNYFNELINKINKKISIEWFKKALGSEEKYCIKKTDAYIPIKFESNKYLEGEILLKHEFLDITPAIVPFTQYLVSFMRDCINEVRVDLGIPKIGEGWISEADLFKRVRRLLPNEEVIHHWRPSWLGRQELDIGVPGKNIAIEYQGEQHYFPIDCFGGEEGFKKTLERDEKKRDLCRKNGIKLIEIRYDQIISDEEIMNLTTAS